ncbi:MAG: M4 family metallopeptidase [Leadbetterella sp.]|nr:M4 family metallopeptidase [Leadbetterella sp.]
MMGPGFPLAESKHRPGIKEAEAIRFAYTDLGRQSVVQKNGLMEKLLSMDPDKGELFIYPGKNGSRLVYHLTLRPNLLERWVYFVDAHSGEVIEKYNHTCTLDGVVQATSRDLNNIQQAFNAYQIGSQYVLIDTKKKMFRAGDSELPNSPVGAILTIDAKNARVDNEDMDLYHVVATNPGQWNATAVSAHVNASRSYDYYEQKFQRLSLNGNGGNIISVINITDEDGKGFDNAFWNGVFMGYGNGGQAFKPLAGSLDVAGHEMTHGVIENTAKLEYRNQPGALNESFADIFGAMIDRDNWTLGEDVVNRSVFPSGALRSLQNPNQGGKNDPGYQPMNMSQYEVLKDTPEQDNGGVHINSGIPNHAFYLFATAANMNKEKAENVYYHALTRYLGRTSRFLDLRLAVIQSAKDLYGEGAETQAARSAFDRVGIVESGSGIPLPDPF